MMTSRVVFFLSFVVLSVPLLASEPDFSGKVVGVADGDTITVLSGRTPVKIRLHGIDSPEGGQAFGAKAKAFTSDLVFGQVVTVHPYNLDRYGRTVAEITLADGRILNEELVGAGFAWWHPKYAPNDARLRALEKEAKEKTLGLWADANPIPPWEWRETMGVTLPPELASKNVGNRRSRIYHAPGCKIVFQMAARNRVPFDSEEAAKAAGYRPGKDCHKGL